MVRATDLTGLSGAGVEAKQEAQNKDRQDERDVKKEALEKYGAEGSGKNLPFSSLSEDLKKKDKK